MNRRNEIKAYVVKSIENAIEDVGVFRSRRIALQSSELPAVIVSIDDETSDVFSQSGMEYKKISKLAIEVLADDFDGEVDSYLDEATARIEGLFHCDEGFGNLVDHCVLKRTEIAVVREGELDLGVARMEFEITYFSSLTVKDIKVPYFEGVNLYLKARA